VSSLPRRRAAPPGTVAGVVDLLRFVRRLVDDEALRARLQGDPEAVVEAEVDAAGDITGEDVEAVVEALRGSLPADRAALLDVPRPVRPVGGESPRDAAVRLLAGLAGALDGPVVEPVTLPHRELVPDPPPPRQVARGGGVPVPTEPPGGRWLHPVIPDDEP
jgi:hypothetical protein